MKRKEQTEVPSDWEVYLASIKKANEERVRERSKNDYNPELDGIIKVYAKQKDALDEESFDNPFEELDKRTFSRELNESGAREFIVSKSYESFWNEYKLAEPKNHYELIEEGEPCHLYFDVEYLREYNPHLDGRSDKLMQVLYQLVITELKEQLQIDSEIADVLELDSSTPIKFSKHLIWHLKHHCFQSNEHIGRFIKNFIYKMEQRISVPSHDEVNCKDAEDGDDDPESDKETDYSHLSKDDLDILQYFFIYNDKGSRVPVVDPAVYTRNRMFRLYLSSKFGKKSPLLLDKDCRFPLKFSEKIDRDNFHREVFMASLVTNIGLDRKVLSVALDPNVLVAKGRSQTGTISSTDMKQQSEYPKLDAFVREHINKRGGSNKGNIRSITKSEMPNGTILLKYNVAGNRYCENISREHKSQHIYLEANLTRRLLTQRCYDSECKQFKSKEIDISPYLE